MRATVIASPVAGLAAGMLLAFSGRAHAQATTVSSEPIFSRPHREHACAVFDRRRDRVVAFGGFDPQTLVQFSDLEILDLGTNPGWRSVTASGYSPPDDGRFTAVYDGANDRMLVLGGGPAGDRVRSLSLAEPMAWTEIHPSGTAPPLSGTGAVFDTRRGRLVGYGGLVLSTDSTGTTGTSVSNLWALELSPTPAWTTVVASNPPTFSRYFHAAAYDSAGDRMLVYGGLYANPTQRIGLNDAFQLQFSPSPAWQQILAPGGPPAWWSTASAFDDAHERWILTNGSSGGGPPDSGTWALDFPANVPTWEPVSDPAPGPAGRSQAIAAYDPIAQRFLMSDGLGATDDWLWSRALGDSVGPWALAPIAGILPPAPLTDDELPTPPPLSSAGFDPARGAYRFTGLVPAHAMFELLPGDPPRWRQRPDAGGEPVTGLFDAWIGCVFDSTRDQTYAFNIDTLWTVTDGAPDTWSRVAIQGTKPPTRQSAFVYLDAPRRRILMLGGEDELYGSTRFDEWALSLTDPPTWIAIADTCPVVGRHAAPMVRDARRDRLLIQGGHGYGFGPGAFGDLWVLDLATLAWNLLAPADVAPPTPRYGHAAVYDSLSDRLVLLGGRNQYGWLDALVWGVQFGAADSQGRWQRFDLDAALLPSLFNPMAVGFPGENAIREVGLDTLWTIRPGGVGGHVRVAASTPQAWNKGGLTAVFFDVYNDGPSSATCSWQVRSTRAWPGLPVTGGVVVAGPGAAHVPAGIPVPDSAAYGANPLTIVVTDEGDPSAVDSCVVQVVDPAFPVRPTLTGPGDWIWKPGVLDSIPFRIVNPDDAAGHTFVLGLSVDRAWPGFPTSRTVTLGVSAALDLKLGITVPDSVADGATFLHVTASWQERPEVAVTCDVHLHDIETATRVSLVEATAVGEGGEPELVWWSAEGSGSTARIQRRTGTEPWLDLGVAVADPAGRFRFVDHSAPPGAHVGYRAGVAAPTGTDWSDVAWLDVPPAAPLTLAFAMGARTLVVHGALDLAFTLPRAGRARLEAYDVRGRLVAARSVDAAQPGRASVRLAEAGALHSGIYFLRLAQGARRAQGRALVLSTP